jgi:hypothetical protein
MDSKLFALFGHHCVMVYTCYRCTIALCNGITILYFCPTYGYTKYYIIPIKYIAGEYYRTGGTTWKF